MLERNIQCPCGSGKKYKQCCVHKADPFSSAEFDIEWQKIRQTEGKIEEGALAFANEEWGPEIFEDGWELFSLGLGIEKNSPDGKRLFPQWFIFRWIPSEYGKKWKHLGANLTIGEIYLKRNGFREGESFLSAVAKSPFSFFLIEEVVPSKRLILKDLLLDKAVVIKERSGANIVCKGMIAFARVISVQDQSIQLGFGTTLLPMRYRTHILELKEQILAQEKNLTATSLMKYDYDFRRTYFLLAESLHQPPTFCNNDGDPIVICTLQYKLPYTPKETFHELAQLCKDKDPKDLFLEGKFGKDGKLEMIEFPWLKSRSDHLVLGHIKIEQDQLSIAVNSIQRSKKIQKKIEKLLPKAVFQTIKTQSIEDLLHKK